MQIVTLEVKLYRLDVYLSNFP